MTPDRVSDGTEDGSNGADESGAKQITGRGGQTNIVPVPTQTAAKRVPIHRRRTPRVPPPYLTASTSLPAPLVPAGDDLRTAEVIGRIWIAPFVDAEGVYHEAELGARGAGALRLEAAMISRLLDLFEGPDSLSPWSPPELLPPLHGLLPWRAWDERSELYINAASHGFVLELPPFSGIDGEALSALAGTLADGAPERCTLQIIHWASPRFGAALSSWAARRVKELSGLQAAMAERREQLFTRRRLASDA